MCDRGINKVSYMSGFDNFKIEQTNFINVENKSLHERIDSHDVSIPINFMGYLNSPDATLKITVDTTDPYHTAEIEGFIIKTSSLNFTSNNETKDLVITINPDTDFENDGLVLNLELTSKDGTDSSLFNDDTNSFDVFTGLVSDVKGKKLAIQTLPKSNYETIVIPVGVIAEEGKEIEFSVSSQNLPEDIEVYLEDRLNKQFINLSKENYVITLKNKLERIGQFYIHTTSKSLSDEEIIENSKSIHVFKSNKREVTISGLNSKTTLKVFSILGEELMNTQIYKGVNKIELLNFSAGIYIIKLNSELGVISKKIILE